MSDFEYKILVPPAKRHRFGWFPITITSVLVIALLAASVAIVLRHTQGARHVQGGGASPGNAVLATSAKPLAVVSTTPASGATNVATDATFSIRLSAPVSAAGLAAMPQLSPPVPGAWQKTGSDTVSFAATAPFIPSTTESLVIPAGPSGPKSTTGRSLALPVTIHFTVALGTYERLQQLLAQLDYLPLSFTPTAPLRSPVQMFTPQPGSFAWKWPHTPPSLSALWTEGSANTITKGAVMNFQNQNVLPVNGIPGTSVWAALLADATTTKVNANPYTYVYVSKVLPENLTLYSNGAVQFANIPVNTGVPGANTPDGTFEVFEHVVASRMKGTNPNGTTYNDPHVPWASFFHGGDALHGFVRASYGFPQSNGCVEMAVANAAKTWPFTPIGTLVTVVGPAS
ncbi:MAG: L,D-transpeptidase family protein [Acidimicrobiales bacterium]